MCALNGETTIVLHWMGGMVRDPSGGGNAKKGKWKNNTTSKLVFHQLIYMEFFILHFFENLGFYAKKMPSMTTSQQTKKISNPIVPSPLASFQSCMGDPIWLIWLVTPWWGSFPGFKPTHPLFYLKTHRPPEGRPIHANLTILGGP